MANESKKSAVPDRQALLEALKPAKSLRSVLTQNVSWDSLEDLLTYELPSPFAAQHYADLADLAVSQGWVNEEQLAELQKNREVLSDALGQALVQRGVITQEQLVTALAERKRGNQPLWRILMQLHMVAPEQVVEALSVILQRPMGARPDDRFCQYLIAEGLLTAEELDAHWEQAKDKQVDFRDYLRRAKVLTDEVLAQALAYHLELPYEPLAKVDRIPPNILHLLPVTILRRHHTLPYKAVGNALYMAFSDAHDLQDLHKLSMLVKADLTPVIAPAGRLRALIDEYLPSLAADLAVETEEEHDRLEAEGQVISTVDLLTTLVRGLLKCKGSDLHLEPQRETYRVRYRMDGLLHDVVSLSPASGRKLVARVQTISNIYVGTSLLPLDGHLSLVVDGREVQFRVASIQGRWGQKLAMRRVQSDLAFCSFEQLGMTIEQRQVMDRILNAANGLMLVTGAVGSGKSTTLYSCLNVLDCFAHNVMTIEDPVEYEVAGITQIEVNAKTGLTFEIGLRGLLRQDPDVIMVGEIRDAETADIAVRAAMTGQLVLSTLHANSASGAVNSLLHLGVQRLLLGAALRGIVYQALVRRVCPACSETYPAPLAYKQALGVYEGLELRLARGKGCSQCFQTGYAGRHGVYEVIEVSDDLRQAVAAGASSAQVEEIAARDGMVPLREHAKALVLAGITTIEEMARIL